jgi:hypothetical protein
MPYPESPYLYREDAPVAGPNRPISQGDVFVGIPLVGPARPHDRQAGTWVSPKPRTGEKALGMLVTHPCASRSQETFRLNDVVSVAPVVRCPREFGPPWDGFYSMVPLPALRDRQDYVAKLAEACPVHSSALAGSRIACLSLDGLTALFHRLAMNSLRYPEIPAHFEVEAAKLTGETDLWEKWVSVRGTEDGFQDWLNENFGGQPREDAEGRLIGPAASTEAQRRRDVLPWNLAEVEAELDAELGDGGSDGAED